MLPDRQLHRKIHPIFKIRTHAPRRRFVRQLLRSSRPTPPNRVSGSNSMSRSISREENLRNGLRGATTRGTNSEPPSSNESSPRVPVYELTCLQGGCANCLLRPWTEAVIVDGAL